MARVDSNVVVRSRTNEVHETCNCAPFLRNHISKKLLLHESGLAHFRF